MNNPRPIYVDHASTKIDGRVITGICHFPSSDPSVGDRVDHVNVAHSLFATWNVAHLLTASLGLDRPRAIKIEVTARHEIKADTNYIIKLEILHYRGGKVKYGRSLSHIYNDTGKVYFEALIDFVAS